MTESVPAPVGMGAKGRRLWKQITGLYELRADELVLLEAACRTVDEMSRMEAALAKVDDTAAGSKGQERAHPLFAEVRSARLLLSKLFAQLRLPDVDPERLKVEAGQRSTKARKAAAARWARG